MMDPGKLVANDYPFNDYFGEIETFNNELYVVGDNYGTSAIRKYDSNYNKVWEIVLENQDSFYMILLTIHQTIYYTPQVGLLE